MNFLAVHRGAMDKVDVGADPDGSGVLAFGREMSALGIGADEIGRVGSAEDSVATGLRGVVDAENELASLGLDT